jgi:hypothetical protein
MLCYVITRGLVDWFWKHVILEVLTKFTEMRASSLPPPLPHDCLFCLQQMIIPVIAYLCHNLREEQQHRDPVPSSLLHTSSATPGCVPLCAFRYWLRSGSSKVVEMPPWKHYNAPSGCQFTCRSICKTATISMPYAGIPNRNFPIESKYIFWFPVQCFRYSRKKMQAPIAANVHRHNPILRLVDLTNTILFQKLRLQSQTNHHSQAEPVP